MLTVYVQKKTPLVLRKPKTKKYKLVRTTATIPMPKAKADDHKIGLRLSQRLDQIILAFRLKNSTPNHL